MLLMYKCGVLVWALGMTCLGISVTNSQWFPWQSDCFLTHCHVWQYKNFDSQYWLRTRKCTVIRLDRRSENFEQKLTPSDRRSENVCKNWYVQISDLSNPGIVYQCAAARTCLQHMWLKQLANWWPQPQQDITGYVQSANFADSEQSSPIHHQRYTVNTNVHLIITT